MITEKQLTQGDQSWYFIYINLKETSNSSLLSKENAKEIPINY